MGGPVSYIPIRARMDSKIKTDTSERDIPLVRISLEPANLPHRGPSFITMTEMNSFLQAW